jgi:hypothetical protein
MVPERATIKATASPSIHLSYKYMLDLFFAIVRRFLKGFISGLVAVLSTITYGNVSTWTSLDTALQALFISCLIASISGGLLAIEKGLFWK